MTWNVTLKNKIIFKDNIDTNKSNPAQDKVYNENFYNKVNQFLDISNISDILTSYIKSHYLRVLITPDYMKFIYLEIEKDHNKYMSAILNNSSSNVDDNDIMNFIKLQILLNKNHNFPNDYNGALLLQQCLHKKAINYYGDIWKAKYGENFNSCKGINDYIENYLLLPHIDHKSNAMLGQFVYFLKYQNILPHNGYYDDYNSLNVKVSSSKADKLIDSFERTLFNNNLNKVTIEHIDILDGEEFELFVAKILTYYGYRCELTKTTGDQGVDILAFKNGLKSAVQAKRYNSTVSNSAIQEVVAGMIHYNCQNSIVVTNNYFTPSAIKLAESNDVMLWDRNTIKNALIELNMS